MYRVQGITLATAQIMITVRYLTLVIPKMYTRIMHRESARWGLGTEMTGADAVFERSPQDSWDFS